MTTPNKPDLDPKLPKPKKQRKAPPRTQGSSFDEALFDEVQTAIGIVSGGDSGIPEDLDDELLGQNPKNDLEENWQKAQEMMLVVASNGWPLIKESLGKMIAEARRNHEELPVNSADKRIVETFRAWKATEAAVSKIIANVEIAAQTPNPFEDESTE